MPSQRPHTAGKKNVVKKHTKEKRDKVILSGEEAEVVYLIYTFVTNVLSRKEVVEWLNFEHNYKHFHGTHLPLSSIGVDRTLICTQGENKITEMMIRYELEKDRTLL